MSSGGGADHRRAEFAQCLKRLTQGRGVWRDDLVVSLTTDLQPLGDAWGVEAAATQDLTRGDVTRKLRAHMGALEPGSANGKFSDGKRKRQYLLAVQASFNIGCPEDLRRFDLGRRQAWLEDQPGFGASIKTIRRDLDDAVSQIADQLARRTPRSDPEAEGQLRDDHQPDSGKAQPPVASRDPGTPHNDNRLPRSLRKRLTTARKPLALLAVATLLVLVIVIYAGLRLVHKDPPAGDTPTPVDSLSIKVSNVDQTEGRGRYVFPPEAKDKANELAQLELDDSASPERRSAVNNLKKISWYAGQIRVGLELMNKDDREVDILDVRPVNRQRSPVKLGTMVWLPPGGGGPQPHPMWFTLDDPAPLARPEAGVDGKADVPGFFDSNLIAVTPGQPQSVMAYFYADSAAYSFDIEVEYRVTGSDRSATQVIRNDGSPFQVTAWACPDWLHRHAVPADVSADIGSRRYDTILKKTVTQSGNGWEMQTVKPDDYTATCNQ